jgi:hypothetical protein
MGSQPVELKHTALESHAPHTGKSAHAPEFNLPLFDQYAIAPEIVRGLGNDGPVVEPFQFASGPRQQGDPRRIPGGIGKAEAVVYFDLIAAAWNRWPAKAGIGIDAFDDGEQHTGWIVGVGSGEKFVGIVTGIAVAVVRSLHGRGVGEMQDLPFIPESVAVVIAVNLNRENRTPDFLTYVILRPSLNQYFAGAEDQRIQVGNKWAGGLFAEQFPFDEDLQFGERSIAPGGMNFNRKTFSLQAFGKGRWADEVAGHVVVVDDEAPLFQTLGRNAGSFGGHDRQGMRTIREQGGV